VGLVVCEPDRLSELPVFLDARSVRVDGTNVGCIVWRVMPGMVASPDFISQDQGFANSELAAAWLAALDSRSLYAVNRYDASVWYGGCHWPAWLAWLRAHGIPVHRFRLGANSDTNARWLPFLGDDVARPLPDATAGKAMGIATFLPGWNAPAVIVAGEVLHRASSPTLSVVARVLHENGISLARVTLDGRERVLHVDAMPDFEDDDELELVSHRLVEVMRGRLHTR
jgi:hypothetical protein